jgi:iron complex transport system substrate-binding protein
MQHNKTKLHFFSVVPNQTLWGCAIICTIFEHCMTSLRASLVFTTILISISMLNGCQNAPKKSGPNDIVWIKNTHAQLFRIGLTKTDSFLEVYDAPKSMLSIGKFYWGSSSKIEGYQKIENRDKIVSLSAIHTGMLAELGLAKSIVGVESKQYIAHPAIYSSSLLDSVQELAPDGPVIPEKLANLKPQILIGYVFNIQEKNTIERIAKNHFPVIWANNHLEPHPLGRAEWIVAMGWLLGKSKESDNVFKGISKEYLAIAKQAAEADQEKKSTTESNISKVRPTVMMNIPYNGQWFVPQGQSYMSQFILDAGGMPITLQPEGSGSNMVGLEKALQAMKLADIWINTDNCNTRKCLTEMEPRVMNVKAMQGNRVFNFNKKLNSNGSNSYWDLGCIFPNLVLRDLYNIIQNDTQSMYFYQRCN